MKHYNITISGRVQGVGFRYSAMRMAQSCGIMGFVRNEPDGSVYIEVEGDDPAMGLFFKWCEKGPGFGRIDRIVKVESGLRDFRDFSVRH